MAPTNFERDSVYQDLRELIVQLESGNVDSGRAFASFRLNKLRQLMTPPQSGIKGGPTASASHYQSVTLSGVNFEKAENTVAAFRQVLSELDDNEPDIALETARGALQTYQSGD